MSAKPEETNITTCVLKETREKLEYLAAAVGLSLSRYVASMIDHDLANTDAQASTDIRKVHNQHGSIGVTIPPAVAAHLGVSAGAHLAFTPVHQAVIIRRV